MWKSCFRILRKKPDQNSKKLGGCLSSMSKKTLMKSVPVEKTCVGNVYYYAKDETPFTCIEAGVELSHFEDANGRKYQFYNHDMYITPHRGGFVASMQMNRRGDWVPAIPLPYYGLKKKCECGESFWTEDGYEGHYALKHILGK